MTSIQKASVALAAVAIIIVVALYGGDIVEWGRHWQTLVAGLLAVVAAAGTVWATWRAGQTQAAATKRAAAKQIDANKATAEAQIAANKAATEAQIAANKTATDAQVAAMKEATAAQIAAADKLAQDQRTQLQKQLDAAREELAYTKQRDRDAVERAEREASRQQAELVTAWISGFPEMPADALPEQHPFLTAVIRNASQQVIYDLIACTVRAGIAMRREPQQQAQFDPANLEYRVLVGHLPPGAAVERVLEYPGRGMHARYSVEIAFQDAAGRYWVRFGNGTLEQIEQHPLVYYGIPMPAHFESPG